MPTASASPVLTVSRRFCAQVTMSCTPGTAIPPDGRRPLPAEQIEWTIPGQHLLPGAKRGIGEVLAFFNALDTVGFKAETFFLLASDDLKPPGGG